MTAPWWKEPSMLALLAANCAPLMGALFFGWKVFEILLLFWLENVVIGLVSIERFRLAIRLGGAGPGRGSIEWQQRNVAGYAFAYFFFTFVQGLFVIPLFGSLQLGERATGLESLIEYCAGVLRQPAFMLAVLAFVASHCYGLYADWRRPQELARMNPGNDANIVRVIVMQLVLLLGGWLAVALKTPLAALVALVVLKSAGDLFIYSWRGRR